MIQNPMHEARAALALHPRCGAHCRTTGNPCRNPSMANGRCRMHGGGSPGAPRGVKHPNYRHGRRTKEARRQRQQARLQLKVLRALMRAGVAIASAG
jgi:hypothetical protein